MFEILNSMITMDRQHHGLLTVLCGGCFINSLKRQVYWRQFYMCLKYKHSMITGKMFYVFPWNLAWNTDTSYVHTWYKTGGNIKEVKIQ